MVRLKDYLPSLLYHRNILFQFLMVRLKVNDVDIEVEKLRNFNSLWCD